MKNIHSKQHPTEAVEEDRESTAESIHNDLNQGYDLTNTIKPKNKPSYTEKDLESQRPSVQLHQTKSHVSTHDAHPIHDQHYEAGDEIYDKFSKWRKISIVAILSFSSFLAPISSTSILAASPEVVSTYNTTAAIFNVSNALYMLSMGLSPLVWGPLGQTYGRKWTLTWAAITITGFSAGSALAPNLASYFVFRMLTAFQGTAFLIIGGTAIGDIYRPIERVTAYSWFMSGTLIGPAFGPFIGGIIVTFVTWRDIFWLQTALAGLSAVLIILFLPETIHKKRSDQLKGLPKREQIKKLCVWISPARVMVLFKYPNLIIVAIASASLVWNMYSLLTPIRYVLNPRFNLSSPIQSGLFYIAPGCGYLTGTFFGGRWADAVVKRYMKKRGTRVAEDRLHSCLPAMGLVIPACMIVYGWSIEKEFGGIPLPVIAMFLQGVAQLSSEVVAGNYMVRYLFGAAGSAAVLPIIDAIGVGWFSTISALFVAVGALGTWAVAVWGKDWRDRIDDGKEIN
ncbi:putative major facilitator superfamily, MFS transporter superfamily [Septoria linicola]|nr:putative major facilitator superfamily, MFS transporter superfamily [Septoria linicola]